MIPVKVKKESCTQSVSQYMSWQHLGHNITRKHSHFYSFNESFFSVLATYLPLGRKRSDRNMNGFEGLSY